MEFQKSPQGEISREQNLKLLGRFLKIKSKIAGGFLALTLFFPDFRGKDNAQLVYNNLTQIQHQPFKQEIIVQALSPFYQEHKEATEIKDNAWQITRELNDLQAIRTFLKPESYLGWSSLGWLTIDIPLHFDFGPLVNFQIRKLLKRFAKLKIVNRDDLEILRRKKEEKIVKENLYELRRILARGRIREEKNISMDFLR